jgi:crotonobetainyl-CoA:carnitine CoA-transferase CaiB-like acyl-CoA transferase
MSKSRGGPLQGVRVVELTKVWAGPYAGKLLAFLGAEVIRVESEKSLDVTRFYGVDDINNAPGFKSVNPQKLSVQIDMKSAEGIGLILDLVRESDVLIENLRPGAMQRLGLGYDAVRAAKPDIIYVSMGMYGNDGPLAYQTGYAPCFAALSGLSSLVGYEGQPPAGMNVRYADSTFGAFAACAATAALLHRRRTGEGQFIDVSAVESMSAMIGDALMDYTLNGTIQAAHGNRHEDMAPHGVYPCRDQEWICIAVPGDEAWLALAQAMGLGGDERFRTLAGRKANEAELDRLIGAWTAGQEAQSLALALQQAGVAATKSLSSVDLVADFHLWSRGLYHEVTESDGSTRPIVGPGWKMSRGAAVSAGAPRLGEHNAYIFGEILGLSAEEQQRLAAAGVTR